MSSTTERAQRWMNVALGRTDRQLAPNGHVYADHHSRALEHAHWVLVNGERSTTEGGSA